MGRKAKLRCLRQTEAKRLDQRHRAQRDAFLNGTTVRARFDIDSFVESIGGTESLPSRQESEAVLERLPAAEFTMLVGMAYAQMFAHQVQNITTSSMQAVAELDGLSTDAMQMFFEYQGFCLLRQSGKHDWARLRRSIVELTALPELQPGLRAFGLGPDYQGNGAELFRIIFGSMVGAAKNISACVTQGGIPADEARAIADFWLLCGDHLENAASLAAGNVLCDAGALVLHYRRAERLQDAELCLSHRSTDGLLHFHPEPGANPLPVNAIRTIRAFTKQYQGPTMAGKISEHPGAPRLCRAIGLDVRNDHGFLSQR